MGKRKRRKLPKRPAKPKPSPVHEAFHARQHELDLHAIEDAHPEWAARPVNLAIIDALEARMVECGEQYADDPMCARMWMNLLHRLQKEESRVARAAWVVANPKKHAAEQAALAKARAEREAAMRGA